MDHESGDARVDARGPIQSSAASHALKSGEGDVEARSAEMPAWRALLFGPVFPVLLHVTAFRYGGRKLRATVASGTLVEHRVLRLVFGIFSNGMLRYH